MLNNLRKRIADAVEQGVLARRRYYTSISLPDEQVLGDPCPPEIIQALEKALDRPLPPSYRCFLELFNGWQMVDGGVDLLSAHELLDGPKKQHISDWQTKMAYGGDEVAARSLVIGVSTITPTKYLLDPEMVNFDGEWQFVQHHNEVEAEISSFLEWLEESIDEYNELATIDQDAS